MCQRGALKGDRDDSELTPDGRHCLTSPQSSKVSVATQRTCVEEDAAHRDTIVTGSARAHSTSFQADAAAHRHSRSAFRSGRGVTKPCSGSPRQSPLPAALHGSRCCRAG